MAASPADSSTSALYATEVSIINPSAWEGTSNSGQYSKTIPDPGYVAPLEVVDLETDKRVFAIFDDGCNHSCHSQKWAVNARVNFKAVGLDLGPLEKLTKKMTYKGLGKQIVS